MDANTIAFAALALVSQNQQQTSPTLPDSCAAQEQQEKKERGSLDKQVTRIRSRSSIEREDQVTVSKMELLQKAKQKSTERLLTRRKSLLSFPVVMHDEAAEQIVPAVAALVTQEGTSTPARAPRSPHAVARSSSRSYSDDAILKIHRQRDNDAQEQLAAYQDLPPETDNDQINHQ